MNRVEVEICGKIYTLHVDEDAAYVSSLAASLDERIKGFMRENIVSFPSAAVMVALALMDECAKSSCDVDNFRAQIKGYVEEAGAARFEADRLKKETDRLRQENEKLKSDLSLLQLRDEVDHQIG
ncbi:MAG: cell division protein ZapA [Oscillospiraceae bacterium]|nr:cell division protein ZapA [Oscillospiraceae bacterium]